VACLRPHGEAAADALAAMAARFEFKRMEALLKEVTP